MKRGFIWLLNKFNKCPILMKIEIVEESEIVPTNLSVETLNKSRCLSLCPRSISQPKPSERAKNEIQ